MTLDMLYSTFNDGIYSLMNNIPPKNDNVRIIIIHQINSLFNDHALSEFLDSRNDVEYYQSQSKGVAISRNIAISKSRSDIILFCDDDVIYTADFQCEILSQYESNPKAKFITFAYSNSLNMDRLAAKFSHSGYKHNLRTILKVGTIEVTVYRELIISNNFKFPEDMGAGAKYFLCDEPVFLSQLLKANFYGIYTPKILCYHPENSSGSVFNKLEAFGSRYLCFTRIFGERMGFLLYLLYLIKNIRKFKSLTDVKNALFIKINGN